MVHSNDPASPAIQDFYEEDFSWCYGCGRLNDRGHHFRTRWNQDETLTEYLPLPEHIAIPGFVYGGLLASLLDCHSTGSAALALYRRDGHEPGDTALVPRCVTASLKVDYLKPTPLGLLLSAHGHIVEIGNRKVVVHSELYAGDDICVRSEAVAVVAPNTMTPRA
ncbi:MAG: PaaI family thioesterase [Firmicutes bacterium]|jgi:acyl-coenzyme A thioesterase PaaI-like protein|uniref:Acyl-coenzyme A thioesterase THEM4 n=1 Tax=Sulfobacillus benefaciens TaxID=453960 RepID=A0A2T2X0X2_9FIRM|nr:PaaI family thioesterase [Bacillota bacterium]PSR28122.1 MAG: thioesterase [Sulfobacillus benefaciens]